MIVQTFENVITSSLECGLQYVTANSTGYSNKSLIRFLYSILLLEQKKMFKNVILQLGAKLKAYFIADSPKINCTISTLGLIQT